MNHFWETCDAFVYGMALRLVLYHSVLSIILIKGLLEPAHSCYGLSLYWVLGLIEYRYSWIWFVWTFKTYGINLLLFLGSCVIRKLAHSLWWELEKKLCGLEVQWAGVIRQIMSFLLVRVCGAEGGLGGHNQASNVALVAKC